LEQFKEHALKMVSAAYEESKALEARIGELVHLVSNYTRVVLWV
jgi:hypothetical protein